MAAVVAALGAWGTRTSRDNGHYRLICACVTAAHAQSDQLGHLSERTVSSLKKKEKKLITGYLASPGY